MAEKKEKPKKKVRNKARDVIGDYYLTNRQITKEYDEYYKRQKEENKAQGKKPEWTGREKLYIGIIAIGLACVAVKYLFFK